MGCGSSANAESALALRSGGAAVAPLTRQPVLEGGAKYAKAKAPAAKTAALDAAVEILASKHADTLLDEVYSSGSEVLTNTLGESAEDLEDALTCFKDVLVDASDAVVDIMAAFEQLPMVGAAFAIAGKIFSRAKNVQVNHHNCKVLEKLVRSAVMFLKAALKRDQPHSYSHLATANEDVSDLRGYLKKAAQLMDRYADHDAGSWLLMLVSAPRDQRRFEQLTQLITGTLDHLQRQALLQLVSASATPLLPPAQLPTAADFKPDMQDAAARVLALSGETDIEAGLRKLALSPNKAGCREVAALLSAASGSGPAVLLTLTKANDRFDQLGAQVKAVHTDVLRVGADVEAMHREVASKLDTQDLKLAQIEVLLIKLTAAEAAPPPAMPKYMREWWDKSIGKLRGTMDSAAFLKRVIEYFTKEGLDEQLEMYDDELKSEGLLHGMMASSGVNSHVFLQVVLLRMLLDDNHDGNITRSELSQLQLTAIEFAKTQALDPPETFSDLLQAIFLGFNRKTLTPSAGQEAANNAVADITAVLKVVVVINSYNVAALIDEYRAGSRQWMYNDVNAWLADSTTTGSSRMFLLLADAGMGKSVFSAVMHTKLVVLANTGASMVMVRHFFKVGQQRGQGKVMLLCLAQQLCEKLPAFADLLAPVVERHGDGAQLSLVDTFTLFLLQPLVQLDSSVEERWHPGVLFVLLDALDEADDGGRGYEPVVRLIAHEFVKLPPWVKVMLTGRPQIESAFAAWRPKWITPGDEHNMADMLELLKWRLTEKACVGAADLEEAAQLMSTKSKGQFIYVKYAFEELAGKPMWSLPDLHAHLPDGLSSMFKHVLGTLDQALRGDERHDLLALLHRHVLPVLIVSRDQLTVVELVWATGQAAEQVHLVVRLLGNLFPCSSSGDTEEAQRSGHIRPYHKSVLDWLTSADAGQFRVDTHAGHLTVAQACCSVLKELSLEPKVAVMQQPMSRPSSPNVAPVSARARVGGMYALRHAVAHACQADDALLLKAVLHDLGLWEATFSAGFGPAVLGDLLLLADQVPRQSLALAADMVRWLRSSSSFLAKFPGATRQLARDAPHNSQLAKHAAGLPSQPAAQLLIKEDDWPACLATIVEHSGAVIGVAISDDGNTIVSGSADNTVRVWELVSGQCNNTLKGHTDRVVSVAISANGKLIVSGSWDSTVRVWDVASGQCNLTMEGHAQAVSCVAISAVGKMVVSGSNDTMVRTWDVATGVCTGTLKGHTFMIACVAVSPDGKGIVSGARDKSIRVWDAASGQCKTILQGHTDRLASVKFTPDGKIIVSASNDKTIRLWDLASGECINILKGHTNSVSSVAITRDGRTIVSGSSDNDVRVWDLVSGKCKRTHVGHTQTVAAVAVSPDGKTIASGAYDSQLRIWELASDSGQRTSALPAHDHADKVLSVAISQDAKTIVTGSCDSTVRMWNFSGQCIGALHGHTEVVNSVAISPDGKTIASCSDDATIRVWDLESGKCMTIIEEHSKAVKSIAFDPLGRTIVSGSEDATVRVWDHATGKCMFRLDGHTKSVACVAFRPDGTAVASGSHDCSIRLWDITSGRPISTLQGHMEAVSSANFSPDGITLVSCSVDKTVRVWVVESGVCSYTLAGHTGAVLGVAISMDGKTIVSGSADRTVRTWDLASGTCGFTLLGHVQTINCVAVSMDGKTFVSGSDDTFVRVWDLASGRCNSTLQGHSSWVTSAALSPDALTVVTGLYDTTVRVWDLASGKVLQLLEGASARAKLQATHTWSKYPRAPHQVFAQSEGGELVQVVTPSAAGSPVLADVYVLPPFIASAKLGLHVGVKGKRLAMFDVRTGQLLCYQLT